MHAERPLDQSKRWFDMLATQLPHLSRPQLRTLALWSFAATLIQQIASTTCAVFLAELFDAQPNTVRQRLREFYWPAAQKPGLHRAQVDVEACFAPLLRWILSLYRADDLVLALDVTLIRDRLAVISLSVVVQGSALPVAWKMLPANREGAWIPPAIALLGTVSPAVPAAMTVFVACDRGLQSRRLFSAITDAGWHPLMRLTRAGCWREAGHETWYRLAALLPAPGHYYLGRGHLFKKAPFACTLIAVWEAPHQAPWLLMTDLAVAQCAATGAAGFYGLRAWIEQGFRAMKSGAYQCQRLRVCDPGRAERIWLVLAVSLVWTHAVGSSSVGRAVGVLQPEASIGLSAVFREGVRRVLGVHRSGWIKLLVAALRGEALPLPTVLQTRARPAVPHGIVTVLGHPP